MEGSPLVEAMNETSPTVDEYVNLANDFSEKARSIGHENLEPYWWYHTVDLGNDLVTPGCYDYRLSLSAFGFPDVMRGTSVLDVGSATGFFAFEFERRGAAVTSVEIPALASFDRFPGETLEQTLKKFRSAMNGLEQVLPPAARHDHLFETSTPEQLYEYFFDGPFKFCHRMLNSRVRRCYSSIYDLSPATVGRDKFDLVFAGDVLWHTIDPLRALAAIAALCRGTLIIAQDLQDSTTAQPAMLYIGGDRPGEDSAAWWVPNSSCFEQILRKLGFQNVAVVGTHSGFMRPAGLPYNRSIIHATRTDVDGGVL
jgi:tRNA (mo5U34)-methyltransferase